MKVLEIADVHEAADTGGTTSEGSRELREREIRHEYTRSLPALLSELGVSLLVSTYQAGKIAAVGVAGGELTLSYHNFERAMGMAVKRDCMAVAARADLALASCSRSGRAHRAGRAARRMLPDAFFPFHGRDPGARAGMGGR